MTSKASNSQPMPRAAVIAVCTRFQPAASSLCNSVLILVRGLVRGFYSCDQETSRRSFGPNREQHALCCSSTSIQLGRGAGLSDDQLRERLGCPISEKKAKPLTDRDALSLWPGGRRSPFPGEFSQKSATRITISSGKRRFLTICKVLMVPIAAHGIIG